MVPDILSMHIFDWMDQGYAKNPLQYLKEQVFRYSIANNQKNGWNKNNNENKGQNLKRDALKSRIGHYMIALLQL